MKTELAELKTKYEDIEGRMRRCNTRIIGVPETPDSSTTTFVSKLLTEVLQLDKELLIDRLSRSMGPKKPGRKPCAIVAKLHYYQDCVEVLQRTRTRGPLRFNGEPIIIFPDYTATVAKARPAFTEVRKLLRDWYGILFPAWLRVTYRGEDMEFTDPDKAMTYVKKNIIPPTEAGECPRDWISWLNMYASVDLRVCWPCVYHNYRCPQVQIYNIMSTFSIYTISLSYW